MKEPEKCDQFSKEMKRHPFCDDSDNEMSKQGH